MAPSSKAILLLGFLFALVLVSSSHVAARDAPVVAEKSVPVDEAKYQYGGHNDPGSYGPSGPHKKHEKSVHVEDAKYEYGGSGSLPRSYTPSGPQMKQEKTVPVDDAKDGLNP